MIFFGVWNIFGYAATEQICGRFGGKRRESVKSGRLFLRWRRRKQCFSVLGKELAAVRRVEAFGKDNEISSSFVGFEDTRASTRKIRSFVRSCIRGKKSTLGMNMIRS